MTGTFGMNLNVNMEEFGALVFSRSLNVHGKGRTG